MNPSPTVRKLVFVLLSAAAIALILGLLLPVVTMHRLARGAETYSVPTGIYDLAEDGNYLLALIIFAFSVVFPVTKLFVLARVCLFEARNEKRHLTVRWLTVLGKWSMLDVFVVTILIGSVHLGILSDAEPEYGIYFFGSGILLSMLSTAAVSTLLAARPTLRGTTIKIEQAKEKWISTAAAVLFVAGLNLPLMEINKWVFWSNEYSVLDAIWEMFKERRLGLGALLLTFVVVLPTARFAGFAWARWKRSIPAGRFRRLLLLDEWSMLDVYVLALLIVVVKIVDIAGVSPQSGLWLLLGAATLSIYDSWRLRSLIEG